MTADAVSSNAVALPTRAENARRLRYLLSFVRPHRRAFTLSILTAVVSTVFAALVPFLFKHAMERGILDPDLGDLRFWAGLAIAAVVIDWATTAMHMYWSFWSVRVVN